MELSKIILIFIKFMFNNIEWLLKIYNNYIFFSRITKNLCNNRIKICNKIMEINIWNKFYKAIKIINKIKFSLTKI